MISRYALAALALAVLAAAPAEAGKTLDGIRQKGFIQCGVSTGLAGFSVVDSKGQWAGLDVDYCRALAAAVLGDAAKVRYTPLNTQQRFTALQSGEIDVLSRNTTWTLTRDGSLGMLFAGVMYYDGQGFMVPRDLGVKSARELDNAAVCVQAGTTTELNLADYFRANNLRFKAVVFESLEETRSAFFNRRCQVFTADVSGLASVRAADAPKPEDYLILPEVISKEPLGPVVRRDDLDWFAIARWVLYATIEAEEAGVTSANVGALKQSSQNPVVQRLLGTTGGIGSKLGLDDGWAFRIVAQVGNYGEIFERNVGQNSPLKLARGVNALWTKGGLVYAIPVR